jgi:hypothetical protein
MQRYTQRPHPQAPPQPPISEQQNHALVVYNPLQHFQVCVCVCVRVCVFACVCRASM